MQLLLAGVHAVGTLFCWPVIVGIFGAMCTTTFAILMMHTPTIPPTDVFAVPFALGSGVYAYDCLKDISSANAAPLRRDQIVQHRRVYSGIFCGTLAFLAAKLATWHWATVSIIVPYLSIALLYPHKFVPLPVMQADSLGLKWFGMKDIPLLKNIITPIMWAFGGSFLTEALLRQNGVQAIDIGARNAMCLFFCIWDFCCTVTVNDCRDYFEDKRSRASTVVTLIGIHASYILAEVLQVVIYVLAALAFFLGRPLAFSLLGLPFLIKCDAIGVALALAAFLPFDVISHIVQARNSFKPLSITDQAFIERMGTIKLIGGVSILPVFLAVSNILGGRPMPS